jgi:uronate dehydrogenase
VRVVVTGGAGRLGSTLVPDLARRGHEVVPLDVREHLHDSVQSHLIDITRTDELRTVLREGDALVHFAAHSEARPWPELDRLNIAATRDLFEHARDIGVAAIVFASTLHVAGYMPWTARLDAATPLRPDSSYAVSKLFGEAMLRQVHEQTGIPCFCLRIGTCRTPPHTLRERYTWLSPADLARLVAACLDHRGGGFHVLWGFSNNRAADIDRGAWAHIGYAPGDDAEDHLAALDADPMGEGLGYGLIGGRFIERRP